MADEAAVVEEGSSPAQSPLVAVSFQRNINRKQKFLEAEPKALGITQIGLNLFNILSASMLLAVDISELSHEIPIFISSLLVIIAGSVAIAAQNLQLRTLRACLVMQILACVASVVNLSSTMVKMDDFSIYCWYDYHYNDTYNQEDCLKLQNARVHLYAESAVMQALLFAISASLAAYCCKVVNCCGPDPKMPVITVQAPPVQQ
ncbi:membrane-spanning 4-domains subfamily A member 4A-like isoform X1 [Channa argus]|uniref:membrane-spanning 4-domains subfamily A member 4A-like isoform X1 n=1 Tax=Channa argus TaxID=215402 RepID=UPI0029469895|nr:hypothetical protein Q8A73_013389 [Channa argus]